MCIAFIVFTLHAVIPHLIVSTVYKLYSGPSSTNTYCVKLVKKILREHAHRPRGWGEDPPTHTCQNITMSVVCCCIGVNEKKWKLLA